LFAACGSERKRNVRAPQQPAPRSDRSELHKGGALKASGDDMLIESAKAFPAARIAVG